MTTTTTDPIEATAVETPEEPAEAPAPEPVAEQAPEAVEPAEAPPADEPAALPVRPIGTPPGLAEGLGIVPDQNEFNRLAQMAVTLAGADAVPAALRGRPNDVFLVLMTGRDLGISLTTALREVHIIEGRPTVSPKLKSALVKSSGLGRVYAHQPPRRRVDPETGEERVVLCPCGDDAPANDAEVATWHAERHDEPGFIHSSTFTTADAEAAKLAHKSNWQAYAARMLSWRSRGYLLDDVFPEVATGIYSPDEMGAITNADGEPIEVSAVEAPPGMRVRGGRGSGNAAPANEPNPEVVEELTARLAAVKAHADANTELRAWWAEQGLPPLAKLSRGQAAKVAARLNALETRHEIPEASESAEDVPATEAAEEPARAVEEAQEPTAAATPDEATLAGLAALREEGSIVEWLIGRARLMNEASVKAWALHHGYDAPSGNLAGLQRWWCEREVERHLAGVEASLRLAFFSPLPR